MSEILKMEKVKVLDLEFEMFLSQEQIQSAVKRVGAQITQDYLGKTPVFIAILNGSYVFAADLLRAYTGACELSFVKFSSYEGMKSSGEVATKIGLNQDLKGRDVVIVEDIIDTGETVQHFLKQLADMEPASIRLASLLVKPDALKYPLNINYTCFEIPNRFVVGYGLDYNEEGRNLPAIYQLAEGF